MNKVECKLFQSIQQPFGCCFHFRKYFASPAALDGNFFCISSWVNNGLVSNQSRYTVRGVGPFFPREIEKPPYDGLFCFADFDP